MAFSHIPVLLNEVLEGLNIKSNGIYVDATFGRGGHSKKILERLDENGRLLFFVCLFPFMETRYLSSFP